MGLWILFLVALVGIILALTRAFPDSIRGRDGWADVAYFAGLLVLLSAGALRARPGRWAQHLRHAAVWAAVVAVLAVGFAYRDVFAAAPQRLKLAFSDGEPVVGPDRELIVPQDESGAFVVVGRVNGQRVRFLVDTGASDTVLSPEDARRLGIDVGALRYDHQAESANGLVGGARFTADSLQVGPIRLQGFPMYVNQAPMHGSLLGLSFLNRLAAFEVRDHKLILKWRESAA
jgi:aspartyl protease family protein